VAPFPGHATESRLKRIRFRVNAQSRISRARRAAAARLGVGEHRDLVAPIIDGRQRVLTRRVSPSRRHDGAQVLGVERRAVKREIAVDDDRSAAPETASASGVPGRGVSSNGPPSVRRSLTRTSLPLPASRRAPPADQGPRTTPPAPREKIRSGSGRGHTLHQQAALRSRIHASLAGSSPPRWGTCPSPVAWSDKRHLQLARALVPLGKRAHQLVIDRQADHRTVELVARDIMLDLTGWAAGVRRRRLRLEEDTNWRRAQLPRGGAWRPNAATRIPPRPLSTVSSDEFNRAVVRLPVNDELVRAFLPRGRERGRG